MVSREQNSDPMHRTAVVVDVETTGLDPLKDEIVELALISFSFDARGVISSDSIEEYRGLREPSNPIPAAATRIHGLSIEDVTGCRLDTRKIESIVSGADYLIAHNAEFDRSFVDNLFPEFSTKAWLCTMRGINWRTHGVSSRRLVDLARHFGIPHRQAHRALHDARTTLRLLMLKAPNGSPFLTNLVDRALPPAPHAPAN